MIRLLTALLLLCGSVIPALTATGAPANYEIEVLVFETRLPDLEGAELWTQAQPANESAQTASPREMAPTEEFSSIAEALRADGRYRVMLHKRWVQPAEPRSSGSAVALTSWDRELDGALRFYMSRFLHVELKLLFQPRSTAIGGEVAPTYVLEEQRRVRSNDLHYFDHPKFGALVRIRPAAG
ncbi:MAG TPA: CsiV family protein [Burkholderiales bacterium]